MDDHVEPTRAVNNAARRWWYMPTCLALLLWGCDGNHHPTGATLLPADTATSPDSLHWVEWLRTNGHPIVSLTSEDHGDLQFLRPLLAGRRVVLIGEDWRGASEHQLLKVRLVKFLHEEMGYDVVALHAPLYGCFMAVRNAADLSAISLMRQCSPGVGGWGTEEALALFEYVKSTQETERPLTLAGFGYDPGSSWEAYASFFSDVVATIAPIYARVVFEGVWPLAARYRDQRWGKITQGEWTAFVEENSAEFATFFRGLVSFFDTNESELLAIYAQDPEIPLVARQTAWSTALWMEYNVRRQARAYVRLLPDSIWAENIDFLLEKLHPATKMVVWTVNDYLLLDNPRWEHGSAHRLGGWVAKEHRAGLYTLALLTYEGRLGHADYAAYVIWPAPRNSLEGLFHATGHPYLFADMYHQEGWSRGNSWMATLLQSQSWVATPACVQYDALLFVRSLNSDAIRL